MLADKDFLEFLSLLNQHGVEYLIIGGHAMAAHDRPRYTGDMDIWVNPTVENAERVVAAITDFGFGSLGVTKEDFLTDKYFVQLGYEPVRIDITADISGVKFNEAYPKRKMINVQGLHVPFIGIHDLIANKLSSAREQDLLDVKNLRKRLKED
jgi:predicted nucleotidyltransferase